MPNSIKYSTTGDTQSIRKGNFYFGIGDVGKGPSEISNHYQGITPPTSGYTIYANTSGVLTSIFCTNNDFQLINFTNGFSNQNFTGVTQSLTWYATQNNFACVNRDYERTITGDLSVCLDAGYVPSYPRSGSTYYNIGNNNNPLTFSLANGVSYSSDGGGSLLFDGVDDLVSGSTFYTMSSGMTWDIWVKKTSDGNIFNMMMSNSGIPYMAYRGTGSGSNTNGYQVAWYSKTGGTTTQRNLFTTGSTYNINTWYNFTYTLVYDLQTQISNGKIYVNGVLNNSASYNSDSIFQPSGRLLLGNYVSNQYPFPGYISRFLVYDRELSNNEIIQNYQSYLPIILNENIVTNGLVLYLDAGYATSYPTTGTTWYDVSGYGRNGTLTNGPTYSGTSGGSLVFDGADDYISSIGTTSTFSFIQNTAVFTIDVWVKPNLLGTAMYFMGNNDGTTTVKGFYLGKLDNNRLWLAITKGVPGQLVLNFQPVNFFTDTNWVNVTITCNGTTAIAYKNGSQFTTTTSISSLSTGDSSRNLNVGRINSFATSLWNGEIAVSRIYDRTLSPTEVLQNFNAQKSRFGY